MPRIGLVFGSGPPQTGTLPRHFFALEKIMSKLSIFVDESGDFGKVDNSSPYYLVSLVFHDQSEDIHRAISMLDNALSYTDSKQRPIHTGPLIRRELPYHNMTIDERRQLIYKMRTFFLHAPISHTTIKINRREADDKFSLTAQLSKCLKAYIDKHRDYFSSFDKVIVYYDNGQQELNLVLNTIFSLLLSDVEFRKASQSEYRLLQLADYICTIELLSIKLSEKRLSKSETAFFYKPQELKKTFIKSIKAKELL